MTILQGDIQILASQVMADVPEGGGAATGNVITDGSSNNIFPDISELDRTIGNVALRKVFPAVRTVSTDGYYGAHMIVVDAPDDPNVSAVLFSTGAAFDKRAAAQIRVESYLTQGSIYAGLLFGHHIAGMMTLTLLQRTEIPAPSVGETLMLLAGAGTASERQQYVRVTSVSTRTRTFSIPGATQDGQTFTRLEVTLEISDPLRADYPGFQPADSFLDSQVNYTGKTQTFSTIVADAARYFGIVPTTAPAALGDFTVQASGIYTQLVPSAQVEAALTDARLNQQTAAAVQAGDSYALTVTATFDPSHALYIGGGILPGSITISRDGTTLVDQGGKLYNGNTQVGVADYNNGILSLSAIVWPTPGTFTIVTTPATPPTVVTRSIGVPVTAESQARTVVVTLDPIPARATLQVSFLAGGRWYMLDEDGTGGIRGADSSIGAGNLNYSTGTCSITLGSLPDVGSQILFAWAPVADVRRVTSTNLDLSGRLYGLISTGHAIQPGQLLIEWNDGAARSATDLDGGLQGDAAGRVWYGSGVIWFSPNALPAPNTPIRWTILDAAQHAETTAALTDGGTAWTWTLPGAPIKPRSVRLAVPTSIPERVYPGVDSTTIALREITDNGTGSLIVTHQAGTLTVGTINYTTGAVSIAKTTAGFVSLQGVWEQKTPTLFGGGTGPAYTTYIGAQARTTGLTILNSVADVATLTPPWAWWTGHTSEIAWAQYGANSTGVTQTGSFLLMEMRASLTRASVESSAIDASGLSSYALSSPRFSIGGSRYVTNGNTLIRDPLPATGEGTSAGYAFGSYVTVQSWPTGASAVIGNLAAAAVPNTLTANRDLQLDAAVFRTAAAPIKPLSFSIAGTWTDGTTFVAAADADGIINTANVKGRFDVSTGVAVVRFATATSAPSNPSLPPPGVVDLSYLGIAGLSWAQSRPILADTLRYNAVAYSYIPLDASILGLDPVRLPPDGRVPIFRSGSVAVVHNTQTTTPATVSNGQTISTGRVRLAHVRVIGADGATISSGYTANLDAGTVTFTNVTGYSQPVRIEHRIEDTALVSEAQITGQLRLTRPLTHDYPTGSSVSSALLLGNLQARVSSVFDQATWTNVWSDDQIGDAAAGTFDQINHPITTTNLGAVSERWAIRFTSSTAFQCYGEHLGLVGTGTTGTDFAPVNPASGQPYFSLPAIGWGGGWTSGNAVRINTVGAMAPVWIARVIKQGLPTVANDSFSLLVRGDIDTP